MGASDRRGGPTARYVGARSLAPGEVRITAIAVVGERIVGRSRNGQVVASDIWRPFLPVSTKGNSNSRSRTLLNDVWPGRWRYVARAMTRPGGSGIRLSRSRNGSATQLAHGSSSGTVGWS